MRFLIPVLSFFLLTTLSVQGQSSKPKPSNYGIKSKKALGFLLEGIEQERYRDYRAAIASYEQAIEIEPVFYEALYRGATCHYVLKNYKACGEWMQQVMENVNNPTRRKQIYFYLGEAAFFAEDWEKALENYNTFKEFSQGRIKSKTVKNNLESHSKSAAFAVENAKNRVMFDPQNLGNNLNTQFEEYLPNLTADEQTIFFTARRPGCIGGYSPEYRGYTEDFFFSELKDGEWQPAQNLGTPVNTDKNEGAASFSPDGQLVYFTACGRQGGVGDCDLYVSRLEGTTWSLPTNLGPVVNTKGWESQPAISGDGRTLYFASNRQGGYGGLDIWSTRLVKGKWTAPENMGPDINTDKNEMTPFIHADGRTLYFASDGHPGFGAYDLFLSRKTGGKWSAPENLGFPLNSSESEANIFINAKGTQAYINSTRDGGYGKQDLYMFELDEKIRPSFLTYVKGVVRDKVSRKALGSEITFVNVETNDTIRSVNSNSATGKYLLNLEPGYDYAAFVDKKGYLFESKAFSLKDLKECKDCPDKEDTYFEVDIDLQPLEVGVTVVLNNIFYATNEFALLDESKAELNHLVDFMQLNDNVVVEIGGHTDNVGGDADNRKLSQNRAGGVRSYLIEKGISAERIQAKGYGESAPVDSNDTDAGRARNRRTECKIVGI